MTQTPEAPETTPRTVALAIAKGVELAGGTVTYSNANDGGRFGIMHIKMADGEVAQIKIELE